ncbi:hypothetical protein IL306_005180 [Fusarium sp. DS 682]|nr:hypothetical protein IL306_005180 [Fusarium sp. DS 682]
MARRRPKKNKNTKSIMKNNAAPKHKEDSPPTRDRPYITRSVTGRLLQPKQDKRTSTLCVPKGDELLKFPVNEDRMNRVCPAWRNFELLGGGNRKADTNGMDFENERAKDALQMVLEIAHGKEVLDYGDASPRFLFYMLEVHAWLGNPKVTYSSDMNLKMVGTQGAQFSPFFRMEAISRRIFEMAEEAKYLYRVKDWLLLALVAERLRLHPVMQLVLDNLSLFCRADNRELPEEIKDSIKGRDWARIQDLRLIGTWP